MGSGMTGSNLRFVLCFLLGFCAIPSLIAMTDPLGWWSGQPRELVWTDDREDRTIAVETLIRLAREMPEKKVIIGTSYVGFGIDTCGTDFARLWLPLLRPGEAARIVSAGLEEDKTMIVDLAAVTSLSGPDFRGTEEYGVKDYLFDPRRIAAAIRNDPQVRACDVIPMSSIGNQQRERDARAQSALPIDARRLQATLAMFLADVTPACRASKGRLQLVLFPNAHRPATQAYTRANAARANEAVNEILRAAHSGCAVEFSNLALEDYDRLDARNAFHDPDDWFDNTHFKPATGRDYLNAIDRTLEGSAINSAAAAGKEDRTRKGAATCD